MHPPISSRQRIVCKPADAHTTFAIVVYKRVQLTFYLLEETQVRDEDHIITPSSVVYRWAWMPSYILGYKIGWDVSKLTPAKPPVIYQRRAWLGSYVLNWKGEWDVRKQSSPDPPIL